MYGQTGAGKTFTMLGNGGMMMRKSLENEQLSPRSAKLQLRRAASSARSKLFHSYINIRPLQHNYVRLDTRGPIIKAALVKIKH